MVVPILCLLWAIATAVRPAPVAPLGGPEPAQYEELTLLFHGALQLGQALNGVYKATEARLTEAGRNLGLFDQALEFLGREVNQGRDATRELRTSLSEIQAEEDTLHLRAEATARSLREVARAQHALRNSVRRLQVQLRGAWLGQAHQEFENLKDRADKQNHLLWALTGHVQRQQREMAEQQQWLRQIQQRLHMAALPA
ncbi:rCG31799 [Rattus norvegicus]|uniref:RCG31799 n=2 Tax=Rattus norvegicus TaxID=10116 RepID=A6JNU9_RAT|nr:angiopoietin-like protein 8 precursor [Rattus norvegicus]EDL78268.1 rCG31799 [Rattus norvegicus]|eukprot:NP_001258639.1 angiopoietin-like protein 8 precursor [Rattus norvegicus]